MTARFFAGTATQLVIIPTQIPRIGCKGGGLMLLCYSMTCVVTSPFLISNVRGEGLDSYYTRLFLTSHLKQIKVIIW